MGSYVAIAVVIGWLALVGLGYYVAASKRRSPAEGAILGLCFGPLGVLIEALLPVGDRQPHVISVRQHSDLMQNEIIISALILILIAGAIYGVYVKYGY